MNKRVLMSPKPSPKQNPITSAENWVNATSKETNESVTMKRLTLDVSEALHRRIKSSCAIKGVNMSDELRRILEGHFPLTEK
jgi:predicted DNA binding CopG/RHH family protein